MQLVVSTTVHIIGTVQEFVPVSWRHYGQSAFQNVDLCSRLPGGPKERKKKQIDTTT